LLSAVADFLAAGRQHRHPATCWTGWSGCCRDGGCPQHDLPGALRAVWHQQAELMSPYRAGEVGTIAPRRPYDAAFATRRLEARTDPIGCFRNESRNRIGRGHRRESATASFATRPPVLKQYGSVDFGSSATTAIR
jgi:hypothetical protein